jgi:hypothetical protein
MRATLLIFVLLVAGCSGPAYRPFENGLGYSEAEIAPGTFEVAYEGSSGMSVGRIIELAKLRAAELTLLRGKTHFAVTDRDSLTRVEADYRPGDLDGTGIYADSAGGVGGRIDYRPGRLDFDSNTVALLRIRMFDEPGDDRFEARRVLDQAVGRGLVEPEQLSASQP